MNEEQEKGKEPGIHQQELAKSPLLNLQIAERPYTEEAPPPKPQAPVDPEQSTPKPGTTEAGSPTPTQQPPEPPDPPQMKFEPGGTATNGQDQPPGDEGGGQSQDTEKPVGDQAGDSGDTKKSMDITKINKETFGKIVTKVVGEGIPKKIHKRIAEIDIDNLTMWVKMGGVPPQAIDTFKNININSREAVVMPPDEQEMFKEALIAWIDYEKPEIANPRWAMVITAGFLGMNMAERLKEAAKANKAMYSNFLQHYSPALFQLDPKKMQQQYWDAIHKAEQPEPKTPPQPNAGKENGSEKQRNRKNQNRSTKQPKAEKNEQTQKQ